MVADGARGVETEKGGEEAGGDAHVNSAMQVDDALRPLGGAGETRIDGREQKEKRIGSFKRRPRTNTKTGEGSGLGVSEKKRPLSDAEEIGDEGKKQKMSVPLNAGLQDQPCDDQ